MFLQQINLQVELENEAYSSLPVLIQLVQNTTHWNSVLGEAQLNDTKRYNNNKTNQYEPTRPGTIGRYNYAFSIEVPNINPSELSPNFKMLRDMILRDKSPKISRRDLFNKFLLFKIPDYGNQSMSVGMLDFVPLCYIKGYKIGQNKVGMIRSFTSKEVYLMFDKADRENAFLIANSGPISRIEGHLTRDLLLSVFIDYKRYYSNGDVEQNGSKLAPSNYALHRMTQDPVTKRYKCDITTSFNKLTEQSIRNISLFVNNNNIFYRVMHSDLFKHIYINGINLYDEIVSRQAERYRDADGNSNNNFDRDFFKIIVRKLYNISNLEGIYGTTYYDSTNMTEKKNVTFTVEVENFLDINSPSIYIGNSENLASSLLVANSSVESFKFTETDQFDLYVKGSNLIYARKEAYYDFIPRYTAGIITGFLDLNNSKEEIKDFEIIPHYDDKKYITQYICVHDLNEQSLEKINLHQILKYNKIYKYNIDLSKCDVEVYHNGKRLNIYEPKYIKMTKSILRSFSDRTLQSAVKSGRFFTLDGSEYKVQPDNSNLYTINGMSSYLNSHDLYLYDLPNDEFFYKYRTSNNWQCVDRVKETNSLDEINSAYNEEKAYGINGIRFKIDIKQYAGGTAENILIVIRYDNNYNDMENCCYGYKNNKLVYIENKDAYITDSASSKVTMVQPTEAVVNNVQAIKMALGNQYEYTLLTDPTLNTIKNLNEYTNVQKYQEVVLYDGNKSIIDNILQKDEPRIYRMDGEFIVSTDTKYKSNAINSGYTNDLNTIYGNFKNIFGENMGEGQDSTPGTYVTKMQENYNNIEESIKNVKDMLNKMYGNSSSDYNEPYTSESSIKENFLALVLKMATEDKFNLTIKVNGVIEKIEYDCLPDQSIKTYIHLPYYLYELNNESEITNKNITFEAEGNTIVSYQIIY